MPFADAWALHPSARGDVYHTKRPIPAHRFYACFGNTPKRDEASPTYMFSSGEPVSRTPIPAIFQPLVDHLNEGRSPAFDQFVVNWYENGRDYTPFHIDWLGGMAPGATVATVSLVEEAEGTEPRHLVFKPAKASAKSLHLRIPSANGMCVTFGDEALSKWRHGVPKAHGPVARRISLSFRSYINIP